MCKFNQNLFTVFLLWGSVWLTIVQAAPLDYLLLDDFDEDPSNGCDYDMTFDQRQNGTENLRVRIDGVIIAFPSSVSNAAGSMASSVASNYLLQLAAAAEDDENSESLDEYLSLLKNSNAATSPSNEKHIETSTKDDKNFKKKPTAAPAKENELKRVTVAKDTVVKDAIAVKYENSEAPKNTVVIEEEQVRPVVVPVKKIQSRRRNKHKLRLGGLLDFLQRYRDQY